MSDHDRTIRLVLGRNGERFDATVDRFRAMLTVATLRTAAPTSDHDAELSALIGEALNESLGRDVEVPGEGSVYLIYGGLTVAMAVLHYAAEQLGLTPDELCRDLFPKMDLARSGGS